MEIEIKEKIDSLEITKNCKHELRKNSAIAFCIIILVYSVFIYNNPFFFFIPLFTCHFAFLFYIFMCREYKYERISINFKELAFSSSYFKKNFELCYKKIFLVENIKEIYVMEYHQLPSKKFFGITKYKNIPHYMIHFIFSGEEDYQCWGYKISIEEVTKVVRRILEKQKIYS